MERAELVLNSSLVDVKNDTENAKLKAAIDEVRAAVKQRVADNYWNSGQSHKLSFADKMAVAQRKVDEYDQNRNTPSKPKKKSYDRGMDD